MFRSQPATRHSLHSASTPQTMLSNSLSQQFKPLLNSLTFQKFSRLLVSKNKNLRQQLKQTIISKKQKGREINSKIDLERANHAVREEGQVILQDLQYKKQWQGHRKVKTIKLSTNNQENEGINGTEEEFEMRGNSTIEGQYSQERMSITMRRGNHLQELSTVFDQFGIQVGPDLNISKTHFPSFKNSTLAVQKYSQLVSQIKNLSTQQQMLKLVTSNQLSLPQKVPFFKVFVSYLQCLMSKSGEKEQVLNQVNLLQSYMDTYIEQENIIFQLFEDSKFWQKIAFLMRKSYRTHELIKTHLKHFNNNQLLDYFSATIEGKYHKFQKDLCLFNSNIYYRQFILTLQRKCIEQSQQRLDIATPDELISICLKQIHLKTLFNEDITCQKQFLIKHTADLMLKLKDLLLYKIDQQKCQQLINKLLYFGKFSSVVNLLRQQEHLTQVEALLLLSAQGYFRYKDQNIFNKKKEETLEDFKEVIQNFISQINPNNQRQFSQLLKCFLLPLGNSLSNNHEFFIEALTQNLDLFKYLTRGPSFWQYCKPLNLNFSHASLFLKTILNKHRCYEFAIELSISLVISLSEFNHIIDDKAKRQQEKPDLCRSTSKRSIQNRRSRRIRMDHQEHLLTNFSFQDCSPSDQMHCFYESLRTIIKHLQSEYRNNINEGNLGKIWAKNAKNNRKSYLQEITQAVASLNQLKRKQFKYIFSSTLKTFQEHLKTLNMILILVSLSVATAQRLYIYIYDTLNKFLDLMSKDNGINREIVCEVLGQIQGNDAFDELEELLIRSILQVRLSKTRLIKQNITPFKKIITYVDFFERARKKENSRSSHWEKLNQEKEKLKAEMRKM